MHVHITIGGKPYCDWLGSQAGQKLAAKAGVHVCGYDKPWEGEAACRKLAAHFQPGTVALVFGDCPAD